MKNFKLKYLSTKFKALILAGALTLTAGAGIGCSNQKKSDSSTEEITTEASVTPEYYDEITRLEDDITTLINEEILSNGVMEITEEDKKDKVELITNAYITMNASDISARALGSLDQNGELISSEMTEDYMHFVIATSNEIAISDNETVIDSSSLFAKDGNGNIIDQNDYEYLQTYLNTVAEYNQAIKDENTSVSTEKFNQLTAIKDAILTDANITTNIKASTLYMVVDSMLLIPNLVTEEETKTQLLNSIEEACENKITTNGEIDNTMDTEASQGSYESRFSSSINNLLDSVLEKASEFRSDCDINYSFSYSLDRIIRKIVISKYKAQETTFMDQQNEIAGNAGNETIGQQTVTTVEPEQVPEGEQEQPTTEYKDPEGDVIQGLTEAEIVAANNAGDAQAVSDYQSGFRNTNPSVGGKSADWNEIYARAYNRTYDGLLQQEQQLDEQYGITASNNSSNIYRKILLVVTEYANSYYSSIDDDNVKTL